MPLIMPGSGYNKSLDEFAILSSEKYNSMDSEELISLILNLKFPLRNTRNIPPNFSSNFHLSPEQIKANEKRNLEEDNLAIELKKLSHTQLINKHKKIATEKAALKKLYDDNKTKKEIEQYEGNRAWNDKNAKADLGYWAKLDNWTLHEGISLLLGVDPEVVPASSFETTQGMSTGYMCPIQIKYQENSRLANRSIQQGNELSSNTKPVLFIAWAEGKDIHIPKVLKKLARKYDLCSVSLKDRCSELEKQINSFQEGGISENTPPINIQEKRELILKGWLAGKGFLDKEKSLEYTRNEVWSAISKIDNSVFRSTGKDTMKAFFKKAKLCTFKRGSRKG